ncbi:MAG: hypothetical protein FWD29_03370 [Micrococcales bacterium]|nr:hypothetical protein [Micrococcales bacterium]
MLGANDRLPEPPPWPLGPGARAQAELQVMLDRQAALDGKLAAAQGRAKASAQAAVNRHQLKVDRAQMVADERLEAELAVWRELWARPQAVLWLESGSERVVARYCRLLLRAESGDMSAQSECRQLEDRLGLSPLALMRLRIETERAGEATERGEVRRLKADRAKAHTVARKDPRGGLRSV